MEAWDIKRNHLEPISETETKRWLYWKDMAAHQFYFAVIPPYGFAPTIVFICPIKFFKEKGDMIRESMPIVHMIPVYLIETAESLYETDIPPTNVISDMIKRGFQQDDQFSSFCANKFEYRE